MICCPVFRMIGVQKKDFWWDLMKKFVCIVLALCLCLNCCACGSGGYGVKTVLTLVEQEYSLAFRNDDGIYFYVTAAIEQLCAEGAVGELAGKWFGSNIVNFKKTEGALDKLGLPEARNFIIGVDINSFPVAYMSEGNYWGFDVELAQAVCDKLGWTLQIQPIEKENVYIELYSGNIDCAWGGIALDEEELAAGRYTQYGPYMKNDIVVASREGSSVWNSLRLSGRNMAMPTTEEAMAALNTNEKLANRLGQITRLAGGTTECFSYLYAGKCDAVLTDTAALYYYNSH